MKKLIKSSFDSIEEVKEAIKTDFFSDPETDAEEIRFRMSSGKIDGTKSLESIVKEYLDEFIENSGEFESSFEEVDEDDIPHETSFKDIAHEVIEESGYTDDVIKLLSKQVLKNSKENNMRKPIKSGVSQAIQMRKDFDAIDDAIRHFRVEYGRNNKELYQLTKELDEVLDKMYTIVHNYGEDEKQKEREAYDAAFQSFNKDFYNELIKNGYTKEEAKEIASSCHSEEKKEEKKKKLVKSSLYKEDHEKYLDFQNDINSAITYVFEKYNMSGVGPMATKEDFDTALEFLDNHGFWENPEE